MAAVVRVHLNNGEINRLLRSRGGPVWDHVEELTRRTTNQAKRRAPADSGKGRASISGNVSLRGKNVVGTIGTPIRYMLWQHEGTGVYAGKGPIRPKKRGPHRRGQRGGRGGLVFAKEVRGVPPNPFLVDALEASVPYPIRTGRI